VTQSGTKEILQIHGIALSPTHSWLNQDQKLVTSILQKLFEKKYSWAVTVNPYLFDRLWSNWQCQVTGGSCNHISSQYLEFCDILKIRLARVVGDLIWIFWY
jgi:hypothetical protein